MYIKKWILTVCAVVLIVATAVATIVLVNPFGVTEIDSFIKFSQGVRIIKDKYYEDVDAKKMADGIMSGLAHSAQDPYTVYINSEDADEFKSEIDSEDYSGVGLYIRNEISDNSIVVSAPLADSPAEKAGIVTGDKILAVDDVPVLGTELDSVAERMKGEKDTSVKLKVLKASTNKIEDITLIRAVIKRETVFSRMLENKIGYIQITQFSVNTQSEFIQGFNSLVEEDMQRLVIDLRNNPGGYLHSAVNIADCFLDADKQIVYTLDKTGKRTDFKGTEGKTTVPMVILCNGETASASEVFIGAMKDYNLAEIVGEKSFGKGVTQRPHEFPDGSILKYTDSRYYTPNGVCIDKKGIEPDYEIEMSNELYSKITNLTIDEDVQLKKAVEILSEK